MSLSAYNYPSVRGTDTTSAGFGCSATAKRAATGETLNKIYAAATSFTPELRRRKYRAASVGRTNRRRIVQEAFGKIEGGNYARPVGAVQQQITVRDAGRIKNCETSAKFIAGRAC